MNETKGMPQEWFDYEKDRCKDMPKGIIDIDDPSKWGWLCALAAIAWLARASDSDRNDIRDYARSQLTELGRAIRGDPNWVYPCSNPAGLETVHKTEE